MSIFEIRVETPDAKDTLHAYIRANNASEAVQKLLQESPELTEFYKMEIKERTNATIIG